MGNGRAAGEDVRRQAWGWAVANRGVDGSLPSGKMIADRYGRHERWGRLVKSAGAAGEFVNPAGTDAASLLRNSGGRRSQTLTAGAAPSHCQARPGERVQNDKEMC